MSHPSDGARRAARGRLWDHAAIAAVRRRSRRRCGSRTASGHSPSRNQFALRDGLDLEIAARQLEPALAEILRYLPTGGRCFLFGRARVTQNVQSRSLRIRNVGSPSPQGQKEKLPSIPRSVVPPCFLCPNHVGAPLRNFSGTPPTDCAREKRPSGSVAAKNYSSVLYAGLTPRYRPGRPTFM